MYQIKINNFGSQKIAMARSHAEVASKINEMLEYPIVSTYMVQNWLSRKSKSKKYNFIEVTKLKKVSHIDEGSKQTAVDLYDFDKIRV